MARNSRSPTGAGRKCVAWWAIWWQIDGAGKGRMSGLLEYPFARLPPARRGEAHEAGRTVRKLGLLNNMWICLVTYDCVPLSCDWEAHRKSLSQLEENIFPTGEKRIGNFELNLELGVGMDSPGPEKRQKGGTGNEDRKPHAIQKRAKRSRSCLQLWHDESDEPAHACLYGVPNLLGVGQTSKPFKCLSVVQMYDFQDIMPNTIL